MPIGNGNFSYGTIINSANLQDLYIMFLMRNPSNPSAFIALSLDDIKITMEEEEAQTYDALGRIDENNIGSYNYTNTQKPFQNTSVELNSQSSDYYLSRANLDITYNAFKSPIDIIEEGKDKLSFIYNMNNSRSTMYYGSLDADKLSRKFRKHYATDGSMEIKQDLVNGTVEFVTYIGGDAYSAPVMLKSDGTLQNYLFLHRDYLGSIVAVTTQSGNVEEKRLFDAWGNITKVQDGAGNILLELSVTDRGYTGHEHLQGVNLIHMNGRLYDPVVHRFLQPDNYIQDPHNTQTYNRYGYALNNPLKHTDPSGEIIETLIIAAIIGAIAGGAGYIAYAIQTGNWSWGGFGMAVLGGAAVGALTGGIGAALGTTATLSSAGNVAASSFVAAFFPAINVPVGDWSISISPSIAFGNAAGAGLSFGVSYSDGNWSFSGGAGIMSYSNYNGFGANANEIRYSLLANWDDGKTGFSLGTNFWRGDFKQQTGVAGLRSGDVNVMYENDGMPFGMLDDEGKHKWYSPRLGNGGDSFRTAAGSLSIGEYSLNVNLFTGKRDAHSYENENSGRWDGKPGETGLKIPGNFGEKYKFGLADERGTKYRLGALSVGYKGYKVGVNSEWVRHYIQNVAIHGGISPQRMFLMTSNSWNGYFQYNTPSIFTSW
jgi:RHS repeat-associated protein